MEAYLSLLQKIIDEGVFRPERTGEGSYAIAAPQIRIDMADGFPAATIRKVPFNQVKVQLEGFINSVTDKKWYQENGCGFWDEWASGVKAPYGTDAASKARMKAERDLGPIYGFQWRHFGAEYKGPDADYTDQGIDQLVNVLSLLEKDPYSRRIVMDWWEPDEAVMKTMALPPCPFSIQFDVLGDKLNLYWTQRSTDAYLGLLNDLQEYALLLSLTATQFGFEAGEIVGTLGNCHLYLNQMDAVDELLTREPRERPELVLNGFDGVLNFNRTQAKLVGYNPREKLNVRRAV